MGKKKILLIGSVPPPYHGTNISNRRILNSKVGEVFNLYHFDISDHRDLGNLGKADFLNVFLSLKNFIKLPFVLLKIKPDLIYLVVAQNLAFLRDGTFIVLSKIFSRARIIIHLRSSYFKKFYDKGNILVRKFFDFTLSKVDTAIVLGNNLKSIIAKWIKDIEVIPNGTDFNPDISRKNIKKKDVLNISYLGNLYEFKGVLDLIIAARIILERQKNVRFIFGGPWAKKDGQFKERVHKYIKDNNIGEKIVFKGPVPFRDRESFYIDTDIFVLPSWSEGHPNVILEAMAAACPVVSTKNVGAISETVIDKKTGMLVEKKNPAALAEAIYYMINNPEERIRMGREGRKRFEQNYTLEKNIYSIIKAFEKTINKK